MHEIFAHEQSDGATSHWIHSVVWEPNNKDNRGALIVRVLKDDTNSKDAAFTPHRYDDIHEGWFQAFEDAARPACPTSFGTVLHDLQVKDSTPESTTPVHW